MMQKSSNVTVWHTWSYIYPWMAKSKGPGSFCKIHITILCILRQSQQQMTVRNLMLPSRQQEIQRDSRTWSWSRVCITVLLRITFVKPAIILAPSTALIYNNTAIAEESPAYLDRRRVRDVIRNKKREKHPFGFGWEGKPQDCFFLLQNPLTLM